MAKNKVDDALFAPPTPDEIGAVAQAPVDEEALFAPPSDIEVGNIPLSQKVETGVRSGLESATFGLTEFPISAGNALLGQLYEGAVSPDHTVLDSLSWENLKKAYAADVEKRRQLKAALPEIDIASQVAGAIGPAVLTGGASLAAKGTLAAAKAARAASVARELDIAGQLGVKAANVAGKPLELLAKGIKGEGLVAKTAKGGLEVANMGVKGAAGATAQELARQQVLQSTGFMKEGEAPDLMDVAAFGGALGSGLAGAGKALSAAKVMGTKAASVFLGVNKAHMDEYLANFEKIKSAKSLEEVTVAAKDNIKKIKELAKTTESTLADDVSAQLDAIKDRVTQGSREAFEVLSASGKKFDNAAIQNVVNQAQAKLLTKGQLIGDESKMAFNYLNSLKSDLAGLGTEVDATDVKKVIQTLDQSYTPLAPGQFHDSLRDKALNEVRRGIDQMVKQEVPAYASKMKEVAGLAELHSEAFKQFGKDKNIKGVEQVLANKNPTKTGVMEAMYEARPDNFQAAKNARMAAETIKQLDEGNIGDKILQYSKGSRNPAIAKQLKALGSMSGEEFMQALDAARINHYFTREFLRGSRNVNLWTLLMGLGAKLGDSSGQIGQRALQSGAGAALLGSIDPMFGMIGATVGASVDLFGPSIAKQMLNAIGTIRGIPTVAKIRQLAVPEQVKELMVQDFIRAMSPKGKSDTDKKDKSAFFVPKEAKESVKAEVIGSNAITVEQKAKMLAELSKENKITDFDKVLFGVEPSKSKPRLVAGHQNKPPAPAELADQYYKFKKQEQY